MPRGCTPWAIASNAMPQHEFERFLSLLSKLLKLSSKETAEIADELCDHLEERYSELVASGISREDAVKQALTEFEDASTLASRLTTIIRDRKRRRIMTGTLGTAAAAVALIATTAFWPDQPNQPAAPSIAVAANQTTAAEKPATPSDGSTEAPAYVEVGQFLPPGLSKPFPTDLNNVPLKEFAKSLQDLIGLPVLLDRTHLIDASVAEDTELNARIKDVPVYLALDRALANVNGVRLGWSLEDQVLTITTHGDAENYLQNVSVDIGPLLKRGYTPLSLMIILQSIMSANWHEVDGEGGTIRTLGNVLTVRNTLAGCLQARALLQALELDHREIVVAEPESNRSLWKALDAAVSLDVNDVTLTEIVALLEQQVGTRIDLDAISLQESGISADSRVTLSLAKVPLRTMVQYLSNSAALRFVIVDGQLRLTTSSKAKDVLMMAVFDISDLSKAGDEDAIHDLVEESIKGPWMERDGEGGEIASGPPGTLTARLTRDQFSELRTLLSVHREMMSKDEPLPPEDPDEPEIRYYRLPDKTADDLIETIPRFVAPNTWAGMGNNQIGLIQKVYVGTDANFGMGGLGGGGMGGGGGGFFQLGGAVDGGQPPGQAAEAFPQAFTVLVIRQTRGVHKEIRKFINELLHGDANRNRGIPHPTDGFSWPSQIIDSIPAAPSPARANDDQKPGPPDALRPTTTTKPAF
jgi:hypothetical protein